MRSSSPASFLASFLHPHARSWVEEAKRQKTAWAWPLAYHPCCCFGRMNQHSRRGDGPHQQTKLDHPPQVRSHFEAKLGIHYTSQSSQDTQPAAMRVISPSSFLSRES